MSVLGYYDILNELGKNILIYPMNKLIIKNSSVDLSASKYAWSLSSKKSIVKNNKIIIPANDTAIILTNESIYVSEKICGTYHPKVSLISKGLSHISTTLDPNFIGISVISIHNNTNEEIKIDVNCPFISIMFYYVNSTSKSNTQYSSKEFIAKFTNFEGIDALNTYTTTNNWIYDYKYLREKMINSVSYKEEKKKIKYKNKISFILRRF